MTLTPLDLSGPWTFDQLADLPDDGRRYEVVDGHLVVTPTPREPHQTVASRLRDQLFLALPPEWEAITECAVLLGTDGRVPDLAVVRRRPLRRGGRPYRGPSEFGLVVEVTSPSTRKTDLFAKPGEYAEAGIPLFWRVELDPDLAVHTFRLVDGAYAPVAVVTGAGGACPAPWGVAALSTPRGADPQQSRRCRAGQTLARRTER